MNTVIIGNSAAGLSALKEFRKYDKTSRVIMISKEGGPAYSRVLLPYVLREKVSYENMFIRSNEFYEDNNVLYVEDEVTGIDEKNKEVILKSNEKIPYVNLLIATGSYAMIPPIEGIKSEGIANMWTKADVDKLIPYFNKSKKVVVIGSGFVALQAAWAAKVRGLEVTVIELLDRIMPSVLDSQGAQILTEKIKEAGVSLLVSTSTQSIEKLEDGSFKVHLKDKEPVAADFIIVGTGVRSNIQFLEDTSIAVDRGILVDSFMRTNVDGVYSAGDVAAGPTAFGDEHMIHALWPTAVEMGAVAGANMAGKNVQYRGSLNMNVTQMYNVTVASMGKFNEVDIEQSYTFPSEEGLGYLKIAYKDGLVVGACLVGSSDSVKLLGKLRPIIIKKVKVNCEPSVLESYLDIKIFKDRC